MAKYILLVLALVFIGCGGGGVDTKVSGVTVTKDDNKNIIIKVPMTFKYPGSFPSSLNSITISDFNITKVVCKETNLTSIDASHQNFTPTSITLNSSDSKELDLTLIIENNSACKNLYYFVVEDNEKYIYKNGITSVKTRNKVIEVNKNIADENISDINGNENRWGTEVKYGRNLTNSSVDVVVYENEYNATTYNEDSSYFVNSDFNESNVTENDWILVLDDNNLSFKIVDANTSNFLIVDEPINKDKINSGNYDVITGLKECQVDSNNTSVRYECPENNSSKLYLIEYNSSDAIFKRVDSL